VLKILLKVPLCGRHIVERIMQLSTSSHRCNHLVFHILVRS